MPQVASLKECKRAIIDRHVRPANLKGLTQALTTLLPLAALWYAAVQSIAISYWLTAAIVMLMSLFLLRVFVLMHECGHGSLFATARLNRIFGFIFGVITGMPQYVWSRHHQQHHSTNGNWARYRGPLNIIPVEEYAAMTNRQQRHYRNARSIWLAPLAGFAYLIFNPRINWLAGTAHLLAHVLIHKVAQPSVSIRAHASSFTTRSWDSAHEYRHMFWNNVVLISLCAVMTRIAGPALFFICYVVATSLAGGAGILLFSVQHNFDHSYASHDEDWDYTRAAIDGTSFLILPGWLNWFTVDIAYHHIHHLSARIPNYCLAACHDEQKHLFSDVTRFGLGRIPHALKCILWDTHSRRIISLAEYQQQTTLRVAGVIP